MLAHKLAVDLVSVSENSYTSIIIVLDATDLNYAKCRQEFGFRLMTGSIKGTVVTNDDRFIAEIVSKIQTDIERNLR